MHEKFNFKEFSAESLVKSSKSPDQIDEKIRGIVTAHLDEILKIEPSSTSDIENNIADLTPHRAIYSHEEIENIKKQCFDEGHKEGFNQSKIEHEDEISRFRNDEALISSISSKLDNIDLNKQPTSDYVDLIAAFLQELTDKLLVILPTDFEKVIKKQLTYILGYGYVPGKISVKVSQANVEFLEKILKNEEITSKFSNIEVLPDLNLSENDCVLEYNDTKLVYDQTILKKEIDEIISQFKQDS